MSGNCTSWSSERIELLKRCFHAGLSCSQIAREIGVTRNAVIGKMNRLGLSRPKDVIGKQLERRRAASTSMLARCCRPSAFESASSIALSCSRQAAARFACALSARLSRGFGFSFSITSRC